MTLKNWKLIPVIFIGFGLTGLNAQTSTNSASEKATGNGGSAHYSIGQLFYQTHLGDGGSLSEGIQQLYTISVVMGIEESTKINLFVSVYPNPTTHNLTLEVPKGEKSKMFFQLYDMSGKVLTYSEINQTQTLIDMSDLAPSNYFVKVYRNNEEIKTFKIIKN